MFPEQYHFKVLMQDETYSSDGTEYPNTINKLNFQLESCQLLIRQSTTPLTQLKKHSPIVLTGHPVQKRWSSGPCSSTSCWLLKWPNTQSSIEKSSLKGNTATKIWNLLAVNNNKTNRGAGSFHMATATSVNWVWGKIKLHNINSPSHSMYSPISLYTLLRNE